ncbi:hypothetical protein DL95DRAFT_275414, partial [Leptodontidium sp. 2 PMI_412]
LSVTLTQWTWALNTFVYSYGFFEPISSVLTKKFTPSKWQGRIMPGWGENCDNVTAVVKNYSGLIALRLFLGAAQTGFRERSFLFPCPSPSTSINPRSNKIRGLIYIAFPLSSAFSGLLGNAIGYADGSLNLYGWQWL